MTLYYITLHYSILCYIMSYYINYIILNIYLLLAECEVRTASYRQSFFLPFIGDQELEVCTATYRPGIDQSQHAIHSQPYNKIYFCKYYCLYYIINIFIYYILSHAKENTDNQKPGKLLHIL